MDTPTRSWDGRWPATSPSPESPADLIAGSATRGATSDRRPSREGLLYPLSRLPQVDTPKRLEKGPAERMFARCLQGRPPATLGVIRIRSPKSNPMVGDP